MRSIIRQRTNPEGYGHPRHDSIPPMRRLFACAFVLLSGCGPEKSSRDPVTAWSVAHYDYAIDLATRAVTVTLTIDVTGGGECFPIPFLPPEVGEVTIDGVRAKASTLEGVLTACGRAVENETVPLSASFTLPEETLANSDVGFSTTSDAEDNDFTYLLSWVGECDRTGPCDPTPSAFSTYRFTVDHDPAERVLCSGTITTP